MTRNRKTGDYPTTAPAALSVREAKAHFSALLERAAEGEEIVITWHGRPRARLAPIREKGAPLRVDRAWLDSMPVLKEEPRAEALVRTDRDGRG